MDDDEVQLLPVDDVSDDAHMQQRGGEVGCEDDEPSPHNNAFEEATAQLDHHLQNVRRRGWGWGLGEKGAEALPSSSHASGRAPAGCETAAAFRLGPTTFGTQASSWLGRQAAAADCEAAVFRGAGGVISARRCWRC